MNKLCNICCFVFVNNLLNRQTEYKFQSLITMNKFHKNFQKDNQKFLHSTNPGGE